MQARTTWKRPLIYALVVAGLIIAYAAWGAHGHGYGRRFWLLIAPLVVVAGGGTFAGSYLSQTGRRRAAVLVTLVTLATYLGISEIFRAKTAAATLTDAERAALVSIDEGGQRRLKHPTLGFSILHPGAAFIDGGAQAYRANAQFYSYFDPSSDAALFVGLFKDQGDSPDSLRELLTSISGQLGDLSGGTGASVHLVSLETPDTDPPRGTLHATVGDRRHYRIQAHGWKPDGHTPFAILIAVMAPTADAYGDVLASFRP